MSRRSVGLVKIKDFCVKIEEDQQADQSVSCRRPTSRVYMSALTNEANIPSSCSRRVSGLSYSKMFPRFITMTRSAVRMVWTRCCKQTTTPIRFCGQNLEEIMATEISKKRHAVVWFDTNQAVSGSKGFSRPRISQEEKETQQKQVGKKWKEEKREDPKVVCAGPGLLVSPH